MERAQERTESQGAAVPFLEGERTHVHREKLEETDGQLTLTWHGQGRPPGESDTR